MSGFIRGILALRDNGLTTSYGVAAFGDRLATALPSTMAQEPELDAAPSDIKVNQALRLGRLWRRLAEMRTWRPLADAEALRETLQSLGCRVAEEAVLADWLAGVYLREKGPDLIRAGRAARDWMCQPGVKERDPAGPFLAACLWRERATRPIGLPFWSAPEVHHHRLGLKTGLAWLAEFLACVTTAAIVGLRELERLRKVEEKGPLLGVTARSRLPDALDAALRASIVTAGSLGKTLDVTPQAAAGLLRQLTAAGLIREATGRASWRAFVLA